MNRRERPKDPGLGMFVFTGTAVCSGIMLLAGLMALKEGPVAGAIVLTFSCLIVAGAMTVATCCLIENLRQGSHDSRITASRGAAAGTERAETGGCKRQERRQRP